MTIERETKKKILSKSSVKEDENDKNVFLVAHETVYITYYVILSWLVNRILKLT